MHPALYHHLVFTGELTNRPLQTDKNPSQGGQGPATTPSPPPPDCEEGDPGEGPSSGPKRAKYCFDRPCRGISEIN